MCSVIRDQSKVETQNLASHKQGYAINRVDYMAVVAEFVACETQGCHINRVDYMPVIAEFVACETQDFASLLADAIIIINSKFVL
jgi:hypothetical protein